MESNLMRLNDLIKQLRALGYHSYQVNNIIKDTVHSEKLEDLTAGESERLESALEKYIEFAKKSQTL